MSDPKDRWLDREAGPIVRPYALTRGRTMPASGAYVGLIDVVVAEARPRLPAQARLNSEHWRILSRCGQPITVLDLAADTDLPVGVVRVLILREVLHGLQAL